MVPSEIDPAILRRSTHSRVLEHPHLPSLGGGTEMAEGEGQVSRCKSVMESYQGTGQGMTFPVWSAQTKRHFLTSYPDGASKHEIV